MEARQVIVVAEGTVLLAGFPVTRRAYAMQQATVVQHRQVEAAAIPRHEFGRVAFDAFEETLEQFALAARGIAEAPHLQRIAPPQRAGDGHHAMLWQRQEVVAGARPAQCEHRAGHIGVSKVFESEQATTKVHVGNGLDVEDQEVHRRAASINAFISRTASARPVNMARPTMAKPMFSSMISGIAATGCTLW